MTWRFIIILYPNWQTGFLAYVLNHGRFLMIAKVNLLHTIWYWLTIILFLENLFKTRRYSNLVKKYVYIGIGRLESQLHSNHAVHLKDTLSKEKYDMLINLASCSGTIKHQHGNLNYSQVENAAFSAERN